nr:MAG TPA: hypothetical protein [Caudoviricetes sp.]
MSSQCPSNSISNMISGLSRRGAGETIYHLFLEPL